MLNILRMWFFTAFYLLSNFKYFKKIDKMNDKNKEKELFKFLREYNNYILKKIKMNIEIINENENELEGNVLYVANHPSMLDGFFVLRVVNYPVGFFIAAEGKVAKKIPYIRLFHEIMRNIFVNRDNLRSGINAVKNGAKMLEEGFNLAIFPEGHNTGDITNDPVGEFKSGSFKTALKAKVNIVPISIIGAEHIQKRNSIFSPIYSSNIKIVIHKELQYEEFKEVSAINLATNVREIILKEINKNKKYRGVIK